MTAVGVGIQGLGREAERLLHQMTGAPDTVEVSGAPVLVVGRHPLRPVEGCWVAPGARPWADRRTPSGLSV